MSLPGNIAEIAIALQAAAGTPADEAQHRMRITGGGFGVLMDTEDVVESTGARMLEDSFVARIRAEGAPSFVVRPNFIALLAYAALGSKAVAGVADPFTHTATVAADLPNLTVWSQLADGRFVMGYDCKVVRLHLESSAGGLLIATATIMGKSIEHRDAAAYATDMGAILVERANRFLHSDAQGGLLLEGVAVSAIERAALDIDNSGALQYGDAVTPEAITVARQNVQVETTQLISDFALWNRVHFGDDAPASGTEPTRDILELGGAPAGISFMYTRPGGAPERSLQYLVPRVQVASIGGLEYNANGDPLKAAVVYRARKPDAGSAVSIITKNAVATYPALP
jgi:hypothetical protein